MQLLGLIAQIFAILTATVKAGKFLQPWTSGLDKGFANNIKYAVGVNIITEWDANFSNATITLNQGNRPGDAQGGPYVILEKSYNKTTWGWTVSYEGMDPAYNNVFYFSVAQADGTDSFTGHYFNISDVPTTTTIMSSATASQSTAGGIGLSSASSTTLSLSGLITPQSTSSASVTAAPLSGGETPLSTIAGVVAGVVVGFLLILGGAWWGWNVKRRRNIASRTQPLHVASGQPYFYGEREPYHALGNETLELHESDGRPFHELHESDGRPIHELHESIRQPCN